MPTCLQAQVEWVTDCIAYARATGKKVVEPTKEFEESWVRHHDEVANRTLLQPAGVPGVVAMATDHKADIYLNAVYSQNKGEYRDFVDGLQHNNEIFARVAYQF
ncbi:hypothetical protein [Methylibium petroleiphilum]